MIQTETTSIPQAIPTRHAGVVFRSRLEARWAVFFTAIGIRWLYEYEGYQLRYAGWYLPDFWLPDIETWVEIKPTVPSEEEAEKCAELAVATGKRTILFHGEVGWWLPEMYSNRGSGLAFFANGGGDIPYAPCLCSCCNRPGIEFDGRGARICKVLTTPGCGHNNPECNCGDKSHSSDHDVIKLAVAYAHRYQFHREAP